MRHVINTKNYSTMFSPALLALITLGVGGMMLTGCASQRTAPRTLYVKNVPPYYVVQRGDTLGGIASRYGLDYRQVGAINGLDGNYTIYPGQRLVLTRNARTTVVTVPSVSRVPTTTTYPSRNPTSYPSQTVSQLPIATQIPANSLQQRWLRPTTGQLLRPFNQANGIRGMWFAGQQGTPVIASQAGTVLYVGSDLAEYGKLVMIQHNSDYISAYAHLNSFNVQEKQVIQAGQQLGTIGYAPTLQQPALEFQVRYRGTPIDPTPLLK